MPASGVLLAWAVALGGMGLAGVASLVVSARLAAAAGGVGAFLQVLSANYAGFRDLSEVNPLLSTYRLDLPALLGRPLGGPLTSAGEAAVFAAVLAVAALGVRRLAARPITVPRLAGAALLFAGVMLMRR